MISGLIKHADAAHLLVNLAMLAVVGPRVLRALGWWRSAALFLLAGVAANALASSLSDRPVVGASGAVAGFMAAHLVLFPSSRLAPLIGLLIALQVVFASVGQTFAGVAWVAHVIGALVGAVYALLARMKRRVRTMDRAQ